MGLDLTKLFGFATVASMKQITSLIYMHLAMEYTNKYRFEIPCWLVAFVVTLFLGTWLKSTNDMNERRTNSEQSK